MTDRQDLYKEALSLNDLLILVNNGVAGVGESKIPTAIIKNCCDAIKKEFGTYPVAGVTVNYLLMLKGEITIDKTFINNFENRLLSVVYSWLQEGSLIAFGFSNINNPRAVIIPKHEWTFLKIDKESNNAFYEDKQYKAIKFVLFETLSADVIAELIQADNEKFEELTNESIKLDIKVKNKSKIRTRTTNLNKAIEAAVLELGGDPSFDKLWEYFQNDKDKTGFIEEYSDEALWWVDTKGKSHKTQKSTIRNKLSLLKNR